MPPGEEAHALEECFNGLKHFFELNALLKALHKYRFIKSPVISRQMRFIKTVNAIIKLRTILIAMKNYVSANFKYYKDSQAKGEIGHVQRSFLKNKNVIEEFSKNNFSSNNDILKEYQNQIKFAETQKGKKFQKNANTFLDCVLSLSEEQFDELKETSFDYQSDMRECLNDYAKRVEEKTGFKSLGWVFHADEGHYNEEQKRYVMNYHAQMIFLNYNFETKKQPLRDLQKRGNESVWSKLQDDAELSFKKIGFKRGESKENTKKEHLEKDQFIFEKNRVAIDEVNSILEKAQLLETRIENLNKAKNIVDKFIEQMQKSSLFLSIQKKIEASNPKFYEHCKSTFTTVYDLLFSSSNEIVELKNELVRCVEVDSESNKEKNLSTIEKLFFSDAVKDESHHQKQKIKAGMKNGLL